MPQDHVRLTRSARKRLQAKQATRQRLEHTSSGGADGATDEQELLREFEHFQNGVTPDGKRRRTSSLRDSCDSDAHQATPSCSNGRFTASTASTASTTSKTSLISVGKREGSISNGDATVKVLLPELMLAMEEKSLEGAPEGGLYVVNVLASNEIQPSVNLRTELATLQDVMKAKKGDVKESEELSWAKEYAAIDTIRRLAIHHPEELEPLLNEALPALVYPAAGNLRSAMVRNALLCMQDVIVWQGHAMARYFDQMIPLLLQRAANEKQFIRDLANKVLDAGIDLCAGEELLRCLMRVSSDEKNAQIISSAGVYASKCIGKMDAPTLKTFVLDNCSSCLEDLSVFLTCKVVDCKVATRKSLRAVRAAVGDAAFVALVEEKLEGSAKHDMLFASQEKKTTAASGRPRMSMRERMLQMKRQQQQATQSRPDTATPTFTTAESAR